MLNVDTVIKFSDGIWYVTSKSSTSSRCLTEQFTTDDKGFKSIRQVRFTYKVKHN